MASKTKRVIGPPAQYRLVTDDTVKGVLFGERKRSSPYLAALQQLIKQGHGAVEFSSPAARYSIAVQAKKHKIPVLFGERDGKLYVRLLRQDSAQQVVLEYLTTGPKSAAAINDRLQELSRPEPLKDVLASLSDNSRIALRDVPGKGKLWHLLAVRT